MAGAQTSCCVAAFVKSCGTPFNCVTPAPSQASATQRAGRAGRVRPGHCFRLCTEDAFATLLPAASTPEMQRSDLAGMLLQLKVGALVSRGCTL
jgi:hypothetical protein